MFHCGRLFRRLQSYGAATPSQPKSYEFFACGVGGLADARPPSRYFVKYSVLSSVCLRIDSEQRAWAYISRPLARLNTIVVVLYISNRESRLE